MALAERDVEASAAPAAVRAALERLHGDRPDLDERLAGDPALRAALIAVLAASRSLTRLVEADADAIDVLARLDERPPVDDGSPDALVRWKQHEFLRIAARDLLGVDALEAIGAALADLAADVAAAACRLAGVESGLAVIGMGKLGGRELNYASDVDLVFAGDGVDDRAVRRMLDVVRGCFRVDVNLRPEGRDGPLVRTVESYVSYWQQWAHAWEAQALLKARPVAGDGELGDAWAAAASEWLWSRGFDADDIRAVRLLKQRAEAEVARRGLTEREIKRGRGGIRDVEFAVQLLQLVHGQLDPELRTPGTLPALLELADAGYVGRPDADRLAGAYRFLRSVEHRLQLVDEQQVHTVPTDRNAREQVARVLGFRGSSAAGAVEQFDEQLRHHQASVRDIHERLWFRPLLEAFSAVPARDAHAGLRPDVAEARLAAFGFTDAARTRQALVELTRGLTRSSRLMQQMLPLLLDWLSSTPDPDTGLLGLRTLASSAQRADRLAASFRDSPEVARRLCVLLGTSRKVGMLLERNPEVVDALGTKGGLPIRPRAELVEGTVQAVAWRPEFEARRRALHRFTDREGARVMVNDLLDLIDVRTVGAALTDLAESALEATLTALDPKLPLAIVALGRLGGRELSYPSDLDVLFVYDGRTSADFAEAERVAEGALQFLGGLIPPIYDVDADLRPEGKQGPLARSLDGFRTYWERWAEPWERLAMVRARVAAGDREVGDAFLSRLRPFLDGGVSDDERREIRRIKARIERERIPASEDPQFHLKLGRGSLSDVEFTAQLLELDHAVFVPSTTGALDALAESGALDAADRDVLQEAYEFCERTRNRWFLVRGSPGESLPQQPEQLARLARSLGTTASELRDDYRRVTRRSRRVVERLFYGRE